MVLIDMNGTFLCFVIVFCLFFLLLGARIEIRTGMSEYHDYMDPGFLTAEDVELFRAFRARLHEAEYKHPVFAEGLFHGLGVVSEEHGELIRAATKDEGDERIRDEALDLLVVAWRFARGDWQ